MAYIIDGNNVMGQTPGWHRDKPKACRNLLEQVAAFARVVRARITVVFDGAPSALIPDGSAFRGVKVLYADRGSDADSKIVRIVESSSDPRGLTVVTSDRHLAFIAHSRGAAVLRSGEFRRKMSEAASLAPVPKLEQDPAGQNTEEWLRYFGFLPDDDEVG